MGYTNGFSVVASYCSINLWDMEVVGMKEKELQEIEKDWKEHRKEVNNIYKEDSDPFTKDNIYLMGIEDIDQVESLIAEVRKFNELSKTRMKVLNKVRNRSNELYDENEGLLKDLQLYKDLYTKSNTQNMVYKSALMDFAENWDCDEDSHKYNTPCRKCEANKALEVDTK